MTQMDIVVRSGIFSGRIPTPEYEVRLVPPAGAVVKLARVSAPVDRKRACEIVGELMEGLESGSAFPMPKEFHILGRTEEIK